MRIYTPDRAPNITFAALIAVFTALPAIAGSQAPLTVASPDGRNVVSVQVNDGKFYYGLTRDGRLLLMPSMLGFEFRGGTPLAGWPPDNRQAPARPSTRRGPSRGVKSRTCATTTTS